MYEKYASVILDVAIDKALDYGIPTPLLSQVKRGVRIAVPLRGRIQWGYVLSIKEKPDFTPVLPISKVLSENELISEDLFRLALWMAQYYCCSLRQVFKIMLPASVRKDTQHKQQLYVMRGKTREQLREVCESIRNKHPSQAAVLDVMLQVNKGILLSELLEETQGSRSPIDTLVKKGYLIVDIIRVDRSPLINETYFQTKPKELTAEQKEALNKIYSYLDQPSFATHLLYGITGSGKTEIYLQAIEYALKKQMGALVLVPEIALTTQMIERFRSRFDDKIAVLHHRLSAGERFDEWHKIRRGESSIVIGARSAVFSPVVNLGLIIVDEEHEHSYKQDEEAPFYNARDVAVMRSKLLNRTIVLGSATPCLESYYNSRKGKYILSKLTKRADVAAKLPEFSIVDMKKEYEKAKGFTNFSELLLNEIKRRQSSGEQTILFLNRRGYHTSLMCQGCGNAIKCSHCDVCLTFHKNENYLSCHLCGNSISPPPQQCPTCKQSKTIKYKGVGTELIEKSLHAIFPEIRTIRLDADTTKHKGSHQKLLRDFGAGKTDVLIGTQMVAKGLHFPQVTLVGVLNCDASLNIPDFRGSENIFQLITQVAGRAGRGSTKGKVILQTCIPENSTIQLAARQDYDAFYDQEIQMREMFHYPPFNHIAKIIFKGSDEKSTNNYGEKARLFLSQYLSTSFELHPLIPSGHAKVKDNYQFQFLIKGPRMDQLKPHIELLKEKLPCPSNVKMYVDIDPSSTFF
jgi:primosomal protein N' (replication factor Y)